MSILSSLIKITTKSNKRLGRGPGSGKGMHTVGRGTKGQGSRKSGNSPLWFEGGALPLVKRMPMTRGKSKFESLVPTATVSLNDLEKMSTAVVTLDALKLEKVIDTKFKKAKIVASGTLNRKLTIQGVAISAAAAKMVERAGGKVDAATP